MASGPLNPRCLPDDDAGPTGANTKLAVKNSPSHLTPGLEAMLGTIGGLAPATEENAKPEWRLWASTPSLRI
jgi:hypothetical protein